MLAIFLVAGVPFRILVAAGGLAALAGLVAIWA
jgi:hypothetical protein